MNWHRRFFWLLLLLLPTQLGFHFWPEWAMVLGRRVDYLSPTPSVTDVIIFFLFVSWFFKFRPGLRLRIAVPVLLFAVINIWIAENQPVAIYKWLKSVEFVLLWWYIVRTKPKLSTIITPLSIGVFYSSILAIAQFFLQHSIGGPLWWLGERTFDVGTPGIARMDWYGREFLRPYATLPHPNVLGGYLAVLLPLIVLRYLSILGNLKKKIKFFYGSVLAVGEFALFLTFSRSAIVVGGAAIILMIARRKRALVVFGIFFLTTFYILLTTNFSNESVVIRQQLNIAAIKIWATSPLLGVGLGNFLVRLPEALPTRTIYFLQPVHNIYLLILSETGIVGFLFFVLFLLKALRRPFSIWHLAFGILLVLGLVDHYPFSLQQGQLLFTVLAGMSLASIH